MAEQKRSAESGGFEREREAEGRDTTLPPPRASRPDTLAPGASAETRRELENEPGQFEAPAFTKGNNAPTFNQTGLPYTVEDMDRQQNRVPPEGLGDTPGGSGATPLSAERDLFIEHVMRQGRFGSRAEAETWTRAVFNALRWQAIERDPAVAGELSRMVRLGETPEVQVEEMMWGGDYAARMGKLVAAAGGWDRAAFYRAVANEAASDAGDPWVEDAVYSFFDALKTALNGQAPAGDLGVFQEIWDRAA